MKYSVVVDTYDKLESIASKLAKVDILADLLKKSSPEELSKVTLLVTGKVFPSQEQHELGVAKQLMIKTISRATGFVTTDIEKKYKKNGDLGLTVEECVKSRKQAILLQKKLEVDHVFKNLQQLAFMDGSGSQERKINLIAELLASAEPKEAKYIVRTILEELRIGVAEGIIRDAIVKAFLIKKDATKEEIKTLTNVVEHAWNIKSDFGEIAKIAQERGVNGLRKIELELGKPVQVMLAEKAESIDEVIKEFGKVAIEIKYDGMRVEIQKKGNKFWVYTRRLEDVTKQFPDLVELCRKSLKSKECVIEGEILGINKKDGSPMPFQILSQRIHRKYDINKLVEEIPIQINLFDVTYVDGEMMLDKPWKERRRILGKIITVIPKKIQLAEQIITDNVETADKFYRKALASKQEGVMVKVLDSTYVFGRHVGGWYKIKETLEPLDLVIIGATWGTGKRAGWMGSFILGCRDEETGKFLECGMIGTGVKEKKVDIEDVTFKELTNLLKPFIESEKSTSIKTKPKIVVSVDYQEIQKSPTYKSGFALRFPVLKTIRVDKKIEDADTLERIKKLYSSRGKRG